MTQTGDRELNAIDLVGSGRRRFGRRADVNGGEHIKHSKI
jgi:hypothetical protein